MRVDVGGDLYSAWCDANPYFRDDPNGLEPIKVFDPVRTKNEFDKVLAGLATLEAAASRAADDVRATKQGETRNSAAERNLATSGSVSR
jgi:hypothetical protein